MQHEKILIDKINIKFSNEEGFEIQMEVCPRQESAADAERYRSVRSSSGAVPSASFRTKPVSGSRSSPVARDTAEDAGERETVEQMARVSDHQDRAQK